MTSGFEYTVEDGKKLLGLARASIESSFTKEKIEIPKEKQFRQARGVFVTLTTKKNGELRGCIGFPYPVKSVGEAVFEAAREAAFSDPRFAPVNNKDEMKNIAIEISILTLPQKTTAKNIEIGRDGLICNFMGYSGLLLPQVAIEHDLEKLEFLEALCRKAGLPKDAWQRKGFELLRFQAQIFSEE